jgi:DinB superfamily
MDDLRYPVGKFTVQPTVTTDGRRTLIRQIKDTPAAMRQAIAGLTDHQLDTPYRPGGWTVRQVAHHVPDSHMNAYIRCKLALTEDNPTIRPYNETEWAKIADTAKTPVDVSLTLLESLHTRWGVLLDSLSEADFARPLQHPEHGQVTIDWLVQLYAWHGRHHVAHITELRKRERWE